MTELVFDGTFEDWRRVAREALANGTNPETSWARADSAQSELLLGEPRSLKAQSTTTSTAVANRYHVPRAFLDLAAEAACHRDESRWALLYRALWRLTHGEPHLLEIATDSDVHTLRAMAKAVHRDIHKMRAFVRFREVSTADGPWFVAWFEPEHHIVEANAPFFCDRFTNMHWSILTPDRCAHWDLQELTFTEGVSRTSAPAADGMDDLWRTYYRSIFNPARVNVATLTSHMPRRYWKNLPEAQIIPALVTEARPRSETMVEKSAAHAAGLTEFSPAPVPAEHDLNALRAAAAQCRACPLWRSATCTVFGEGPAHAKIVIVGEQPGDQEDRRGQPFVGPAGHLLDRALVAAGVHRSAVYLTNAVKHFTCEPRG